MKCIHFSCVHHLLPDIQIFCGCCICYVSPQSYSDMKPYTFVLRQHTDILIEKAFIASSFCPSFVFGGIPWSSGLILPNILLVLTDLDDFV